MKPLTGTVTTEMVSSGSRLQYSLLQQFTFTVVHLSYQFDKSKVERVNLT